MITSPTQANHDIHWVLAAPVLDPSGRTIGVVVGNLNEASLHGLLNPELQSAAEVIAVDNDHHFIYSTALGAIDGRALLAKGSLTRTINNQAVTQAEAGQSGAAQYRSGGQDVIAGYDGVDSLGWTILVQEPRSAVLAPVGSQRARGHRLGVDRRSTGHRLLHPVRPARGQVPDGRRRREHQGQYVGEFGGGGVVGVVGGVGRHDHRTERRGDPGVGHHRRTGPGVGVDRRHGRRGRPPSPPRPGTTSNRPRPTSTASSERTLALAERVSEIGAS